MIIVLLADGFEELEALTPVDIMRRRELDVKTVGVTGKTVTGAHGITVTADLVTDEVMLDTVELAVFPGGMPGAINLDGSPFTDKVIAAIQKNGGRLAAICAAPLVLGRRGLLEGRRAICFPGFEKELRGARITDSDVVTDGKITTARGMTASMKFAEELADLITGVKKDPYDELERILEAITPSREEKLEVEELAIKILELYDSFDVGITIEGYERGPRITRFTVLPAKNTKVSAIVNLKDDLAFHMAQPGVRIVAPLPDKNAIGIEIPNKNQTQLTLYELLDSPECKISKSSTLIPLGKDATGATIFCDISRLGHLIIGGARDTGKSSLLRAVITSVLLRSDPADTKLILIDTSGEEFDIYQGVSSLLAEPITDPKSAVGALRYLLGEAQKRAELIRYAGAKTLSEYNENACKTGALTLPKIICVIDELSDVLAAGGKVSESYLAELTSCAHKVGIHLILSTARTVPSVLTRSLLAGIPARIAFRVHNVISSRTVIEASGANDLLDRGDILYRPYGATSPLRVQCAYIDRTDAKRVADAKRTHPEISPLVTDYSGIEFSEEKNIDTGCSYLYDKEFISAAEISVKAGRTCTSMLQRQLSIGYGKAAKYIDIMESLGIVSERNGQKPRNVLITEDEWHEMLERIKK